MNAEAIRRLQPQPEDGLTILYFKRSQMLFSAPTNWRNLIAIERRIRTKGGAADNTIQCEAQGAYWRFTDLRNQKGREYKGVPLIPCPACGQQGYFSRQDKKVFVHILSEYGVVMFCKHDAKEGHSERKD